MVYLNHFQIQQWINSFFCCLCCHSAVMLANKRIRYDEYIIILWTRRNVLKTFVWIYQVCFEWFNICCRLFCKLNKSMRLECERVKRPVDDGLFVQREIQDITLYHLSNILPQWLISHLASGGFFQLGRLYFHLPWL